MVWVMLGRVVVTGAGCRGYCGVMRYPDGGGLTAAGRVRREEVRLQRLSAAQLARLRAALEGRAARRSQDVGRLVEPAAALPGFGEDFLQPIPEAQSPSPTASTGRACRGGHSRAAGPPTIRRTPGSRRPGRSAPCGHPRGRRSAPAGTACAPPAGCSHGCRPPTGTRVHPDRSRAAKARCSAFQVSVSRVITAADSPAEEPRNWPSAGTKSRTTGHASTAAAAPR